MSSEASNIREFKVFTLAVCFVATLIAVALAGSQLELELADPIGRRFFYGFCIVAALLSPLQMLAIVGMQYHQRSSATWERPTLDSPIWPNPVGFYHFAVLLAFATAASWLLGAIFAGWYALVIGVTCLLVACGWHVGLRWALHRAHRQLAAKSDDNTSQAGIS